MRFFKTFLNLLRSKLLISAGRSFQILTACVVQMLEVYDVSYSMGCVNKDFVEWNENEHHNSIWTEKIPSATGHSQVGLIIKALKMPFIKSDGGRNVIAVFKQYPWNGWTDLENLIDRKKTST